MARTLVQEMDRASSARLVLPKKLKRTLRRLDQQSPLVATEWAKLRKAQVGGIASVVYCLKRIEAQRMGITQPPPSEDNLDVPPFLTSEQLRRFQTNLYSEFRSSLKGSSSGAAGSHWKQFWDAFEYRRMFSWLEESVEEQQRGLTAALRQALTTYNAPEAARQTHVQLGRASALPMDPYNRSSLLSREQREALWHAAEDVVRDERAVEEFAFLISFVEQPFEDISTDSVLWHVLQALDDYAERRDVGVQYNT